MDVACQLVCCGVDPLRRTSFSSSFITTTTSHHRSFPSTIRIRRRNGVVRAVATEPKPTDTGPSRSPPKVVNGSPRSSPPKAVNGASTRMEDVSKEIKRVRAQMEENEQLAILMKGLRGQNLRDSQFADDNIQLRLVEIIEPDRSLLLFISGHSSRGPTLMHGSDWNPSGGILHIVPNELNQVVDGYTPLASRLGVLARDGNLMPLTYRTWSHVPKENKERIWREVKVNTDADESMKKFVLASVGKKWREWKARVKQMGYTPFDNDADRLTHRPERVHEHQWRSLVYYWGTQKAQKKSTKNKEIRKKKTLNHITGRKPFSVVRVEETNKKNGVPATRLEVWMAGYSKDNKPSNDKVAEVMTQMKDLGAQSNATDEEIITQVLGPERPGRVRTYGLGLSPTDVFGGGYRQSQEQTRIIQMQVQEQLNQYKAQMEMQMKEMMDAMLNQQKVQMEMQGTIQAQQARIEQLESQQAMGGPIASAATHVHSQQQSHAYTSSFNCHRSSEEVHISKKEKKKKKKK